MFSLLSSLAPLAGSLLGDMFGGGGQQRHAMGGSHYANGGYAEGGDTQDSAPATGAPFVQPMSHAMGAGMAPYAHGGYAGGGYGYSHGGDVMSGQYGPMMHPHHMMHPAMQGQYGPHMNHMAHGGHMNGIPHYGWGGLGGMLSSAWNAVKPMAQNALAQHGPALMDKAMGIGQNLLSKGADYAGNKVGDWVGSKFGQGAGDAARGAISGGINKFGNQGLNMAGNMAGSAANRFMGMADGGPVHAHQMMMQLARRHPLLPHHMG